jgi:D-alanyl-D-alanine carboxypeptidase/D-alanyl-D-alanine-endopeptidase (penicillin-binding protein 4)
MNENRAAPGSGDWKMLRFLLRRLWWLVVVCAAGLPSFVFFAGRPRAEKTPEAIPAETKQAPLEPGAKGLRQAIERAVAGSAFASARWGVCAVSLRDGRVVAALGARELMSPASTFKTYTTAAALDLLGADFRWKTSVLASATPDAEGVINGDVTLYGRGAADLATEHLARLAAQLQQKGVRRVRGAVAGDETYFRADLLGDGWLWNDVQWYFGAEISALSVNGNEVAVNAAPGRTDLTPPTDYVRVANTIKAGGAARLGVNRGLSDNDARVWGETPPGQGVRARLAVHRPALWAAQLFRRELMAKGIAVDGEAKATDALVTDDAQRLQPDKMAELASVQSATLGEIVRQTNKESLNLNAELILRTLGKLQGDTAPPPAPDKLDEHHDDKRGLAVLKTWLQQHGIDASRLSLRDGSGLSRLDLVTPEASARVLAAIAKTPAADAFRQSLPVAGRDGTLAGRLKPLSGQVFAKTGTLTHANALAGYATAANGEPLAFAIICNGDTAPGSSSAVIDEIVRLLASYNGD